MHLINGLYDCHRSRVPVLAIAAQFPAARSGTNYFQETRPDALFNDCSHFCESMIQPEQMPRILDIAIRTALGRGAYRSSASPATWPCARRRTAGARWCCPAAPGVLRPADAVAMLATLLNEGEQDDDPGGAGLRRRARRADRDAERLEAPIVHAMRGKEHVEYDNPFDVGMTGLLGFASGYYAMMDCDLLLMLGTDFPYPQFYPTQGDRRAGRRPPGEPGAPRPARPRPGGRRAGDAGGAAAAHRGEAQVDRKHLDSALAHYRKARRRSTIWRRASRDKADPPSVPDARRGPAGGAATRSSPATSDCPTLWAARYLTMNGRRRLIGSFSHGSMANAMPQAIGAQLAFPDRQVISLSGDGGFTMLMGDLLTIRQRKLPVKIVVYNNGALGVRRAGDEGGRAARDAAPSWTTRTSPRWRGRWGFTARGSRIPAEVEPALSAAFAHDGPAIVDVVVNRQELAMPPTITAEQAKGFTLYMLKAVLSGRGDEVLDLAKTNLWR